MDSKIMLGLRAHDFGKADAESLAKILGRHGATCTQLALSKAIDGINVDIGNMSPGLGKHMRNAFSKQGVSIAVLGCYINPIHPDEAMRRKSLNKFKEHIRFARDFGCSIVGTETGSMNADFSYHPDTHTEVGFDLLIKSVSELVEEAEKFGVIVGIEGVTKHVVSTPKKMKRVLDIIDSNNLQVIFDPANFLSIDNYKNQDEIIKEAFELFGDRIVIIHAKDFVIEEGKMKTVEAGKGMLNYELLFSLIKQHKPYIEVLLENAKPDTVDETMEFISSL